MGYDEIVWSSPESLEEVQELMDAVAHAHKNFQPTNFEEDEEFNRQLEALKSFKNIDLSQLGEDDG